MLITLINQYSHQTGGRLQLSPRVPRSRCPCSAQPRLLLCLQLRRTLCKFPAQRGQSRGEESGEYIHQGEGRGACTEQGGVLSNYELEKGQQHLFQ